MTIIFNEIFKESFGTSVSFRYKNYISVTGKNEEQRIVQWDNPLLTFDLSREVMSQQELDDLLEFHAQQKGKEKVFLYKDPFDNFIGRQYFNRFYYNNNNVHHNYIEGVAIAVGENRYKLEKKYVGRYDGNTQQATLASRRINYPYNITLYYPDQSICTDWTWNYETKEIETTSSIDYWCSFNFYVPVRFGDDEIEYTLLGYDGVDAFYSISKLSLIEVREENNITTWTNACPSFLNSIFALDGFADSNLGFQSNTIIEENDSGFEQRENDGTKIFNITLGDRLLNPDEIAYLILFYRVTRGSGVSFTFQEISTQQIYVVRFDSELSLKLEGSNNCGVLASLNSLSLVEVKELNKSISVGSYSLGFQEKRKYDLYYGFSSANGIEHSAAKVKQAYLNGQQFIGGGNVPKTVNGYASLASINDEVVLVPDQKETVGSCFVSRPLPVDFNIHNFSFYFVCDTSNDGLAFILHGQSTGASAIGVMSSALGNSVNYLTTAQILNTKNIEGKSIGYVGIAPSIIVELDCYKNEFDPNDNHVGLNLNGSLTSYSYGFPSFNLQNTSNISVWIDYSNPTLNIYVNNSSSKPSSPLISTSINIPDYLGYYQEIVASAQEPIEKGIAAQTLCLCWKITRLDGLVIGATNHDKDIILDSVVYHARGGFSGTAFESDYEMTVDNSEIKSFFVTDFVTEKDIVGGKFDEAEVIVYLVDWDTQQILSILQSGIVGQISNTNRIYTLEVRNIFELLTKKNTNKTSSNCPLVFGETGANKCNKDLSGLTHNTTVASVISNKKFTLANNFGDGYFDFGIIEFLSGENAGMKFDIYKYASNIVDLWQVVPYPININDLLKLTKGCEKSLKACQAYNNVANFGGDPFVPGADTYMTGALEYSNPID